MDYNQDGTPAKPAGLGSTDPASGSKYEPMPLGAMVWQMLHPEQVQAEYVALGQEPPSKIAIVASNAAGAFDPFNLIQAAFDNTAQSAEAAGNALDRAAGATGDIAKKIGENVGTLTVLAIAAYIAYQANERKRAGK